MRLRIGFFPANHVCDASTRDNNSLVELPSALEGRRFKMYKVPILQGGVYTLF